MKSILAIFCCALLLLSATLQAQGVYVTPGANGPVFSDKPQPGAKPVTLQPLNVVAPPPKPKAATIVKTPDQDERAKPDAAISTYRSFSIVSPESGGSVVANTAIFEVRVAIDPPLQLGDGHAFAVSINGRAVDQRFTATEFMIPPEFWSDTLPPANQQLQLDASIVDFNGQVLKKAAPVRFYMRYAQVQNKPKRPLPRPLPGSTPAASRSKPPTTASSVGESKNFSLDQ